MRKLALMKVRGEFFNDLNIENHQALITARREPDLVLSELTLHFVDHSQSESESEMKDCIKTSLSRSVNSPGTRDTLPLPACNRRCLPLQRNPQDSRRQLGDIWPEGEDINMND